MYVSFFSCVGSYVTETERKVYWSCIATYGCIHNSMYRSPGPSTSFIIIRWCEPDVHVCVVCVCVGGGGACENYTIIYLYSAGIESQIELTEL